MHIENIKIVNFKNLEGINIDFSRKLNCFIGNNGAGKTNFLDAIYYLSFCKSFFNATDQYNFLHNESYFMLRGEYIRDYSPEIISCSLQKGQKKQFKRNDKIYLKLADHIGFLPLVMITPSDMNLITGGSEERRKFIDGVISQSDHNYLKDLLNYNKALIQRNNLLKQFANEGFFNEEMLTIWDMQLIDYGNRIHEKRRNFIEKLIPVFQHYYNLISEKNETVSLVFESDLLNNDFNKTLNLVLKKDRLFQYTTVGIHREDMILKLEDFPIKKLGSQGQKKTYLIALKLAQFEFMKQITGFKPILLLDDIFDKLDHKRVKQIVNLVADDHFGQIFFTDTNRDHLDKIIKSIHTDFRIYNISNGSVKILE